MRLLFLIILFCVITMASIEKEKDAMCWALCRTEGFDSGYYEKETKACDCLKRIKFKDISQPKVKIQRAPDIDYQSDD